VRARIGSLLRAATDAGEAILAFNVYTIDQAGGVIDGASAVAEPVIVQVHPGGSGDLLVPFIAALCAMRDRASIPVAIQLDHTTGLDIVAGTVVAGVDGVMVDGSASDAAGNADLLRRAREMVGPDVWLEGELGKLSGTEDGDEQPVGELTDPEDVVGFVELSKIDALGVSIGNVHGSTASPPNLDLDRLRAIRAKTSLPLVLHGASGLSPASVREAVSLGIAKINVNTEIRTVYRQALRGSDPELAPLLRVARAAVAEATRELLLRR
jgi:tagatose 1,6-diphosphate aldolase GatY/KbaY